MVKSRFRVQNIEGFQPVIDQRNLDKVYVLDGKNYYFDAKGPKSGFGTRLVADNSLIELPGGVVQSITAGKATYVFTTKGCYVMAENGESWIQVLDLAARWPDVPLKDDKKWTFVYLTKGVYFCHPVYGFYKMVKTPTDWYLDPRDQDDIPGLPFQPQAICETNGRMIVLGFKYVAWSGPSDAEDFLPALGGAGFEILSDRVAGAPVTVVGFQTGYIVWTVQGCLTAEFIGGDTVFRFNRATTEQLPVNAYAVEALPDGSQVICTKQGIFQIQNAQEPTQIAPLFSEFIRQRLEHETAIHVRLTYAMEQDLLFFQMRDWTNHYVRTYVCSLALDKWGSFDERHLGIIKLIPDRGNWGYVDAHGRPHRFVETFNREVTPHHFGGLDSNVTIGYFKPPELHGETDSLLEMHEINIGGHPAIPSWYEVDNVDLGLIPVLMSKGRLHLHGLPATLKLDDAAVPLGVSRVGAVSGTATWDGNPINILAGQTVVIAIFRQSILGSSIESVKVNGTDLTRIALSPVGSPETSGLNYCWLEFWSGKPAAGTNVPLVAECSTSFGITFVPWLLGAANSGTVAFAYGNQDNASGSSITVPNVIRDVGTVILGAVMHDVNGVSTSYTESWTGAEIVHEDWDTTTQSGNNRFAAIRIVSLANSNTDDLTFTSGLATAARVVGLVGIGP